MRTLRAGVALPPTASRCQAWKYQVCPVIADMLPFPVGMASRSTEPANDPVAPDDFTPPPTPVGARARCEAVRFFRTAVGVRALGGWGPAGAV